MSIAPQPRWVPSIQFLASDASVTLTGSLVGAHDGIPAGYSHEVLAHLSADLADGPDLADGADLADDEDNSR